MNKYVESTLARVIYASGFLYRLYKNIKVKRQKRILVTGTDAVGDTVCRSAFLRELRRSYPEYKITYVCHPSIKNMVETCPYIDEVFLYDNRVYKRRFLSNVKRSFVFIRRYFRDRNYEIAIVPYYDSIGIYPDMYISWFSGADKRIAYDECVNEEMHDYFMGVHDLYFNRRCCHKEGKHEVESQLNLLEFMGNKVGDSSLELWSTDDDKMAVDNLFSHYNVDERKTGIVVVLSSSSRTKDWPVDKYIDVCKKIEKVYDVNFFVVGAGKIAKQDAMQFKSSVINAYDFVDKTTLRQTSELIKRADVYFGGDTGPLHIAAVWGLQGVALYKNAKTSLRSPRSDERFAPWQSKIQIIQPEENLPGCEYDCGKDYHCINQISADRAFLVIKEICAGYIRGDGREHSDCNLFKK